MNVRDIPIPLTSGNGNQSTAIVPLRGLAATTLGRIDRSVSVENGDILEIVGFGSADTNARTGATARVNDSIATGNLIVDAVNTLDSVLTEMEGLVTRARDTRLSTSELSKIEIQARDLAGEFSDRAAFALPNGQQPFRGGIVGFASDQQLETDDTVTFPDTNDSPLRTIETITFSSPEAIIATAREVQRARTSLENFKSSATILQTALAERSKLFAVASQNETAATAVVGDVDRASELAKATQGLIGENPATALNASSVRAPRVATLLER